MAELENKILASFKILLVGESFVGKSSILLRFAKGSFSEDQKATIGADFASKTIFVDGDYVRLVMWDTAGSERFRALTSNFYRNAHAAIFVYDVTAPGTFHKLQEWMNEVKVYCEPNVVKMVVGNKTDIKDLRAISTAEGEEFASRHRMMFLETSAKNDEGVQEAFEEVARKVIQTPGLWEAANPQISVQDDSHSKTSTGWSCCG